MFFAINSGKNFISGTLSLLERSLDRRHEDAKMYRTHYGEHYQLSLVKLAFISCSRSVWPTSVLYKIGASFPKFVPCGREETGTNCRWPTFSYLETLY